MSITLRLTSASVSYLRYDLGGYGHDFPRGLKIVVEDSDGHQTSIDAPYLEAERYVTPQSEETLLCINRKGVTAITFTLTKGDPVFDWSMAELSLYK
jgi:hypothetical protein